MNFLKKYMPMVVILGLIGIFYAYNIGRDKDMIAKMKMREAEIKKEISSLRLELNRLEDYYEMSKTKEFVERMAREKLGMVKKNEVIYYIKYNKNLPEGVENEQ
ncbi:MAG: septum formation initiator family protein [Bacillota bacterium]|nr:septum formation initiator family protein [Bacillota bacterium]